MKTTTKPIIGRPRRPNSRRNNLPWRVDDTVIPRLEFYALALGVNPGDILNELVSESHVAEYVRLRDKKEARHE